MARTRRRRRLPASRASSLSSSSCKTVTHIVGARRHVRLRIGNVPVAEPEHVWSGCVQMLGCYGRTNHRIDRDTRKHLHANRRAKSIGMCNVHSNSITRVGDRTQTNPPVQPPPKRRALPLPIYKSNYKLYTAHRAHLSVGVLTSPPHQICRRAKYERPQTSHHTACFFVNSPSASAITECAH